MDKKPKLEVVNESVIDTVEVDGAKKILDKISEYSVSNQNIVKSVGEIDSEIKKLTDLKAQYINLALTNNGAIQALQALIEK